MHISSRISEEEVWTVRSNGRSRPGGVPAGLRAAAPSGRALVVRFAADGVSLERTKAWQRASTHVAHPLAALLRQLTTKRDRLFVSVHGDVRGNAHRLWAAATASGDSFVVHALRARDEEGFLAVFEPSWDQLPEVIRWGWNLSFRAFVVSRASFRPSSRVPDPLPALVAAQDSHDLARVERELKVASIVCEAWSDESALRLWSITVNRAALARRLRPRPARH
jgi:hypothetical protein